jgi:hypothetical protein
VGIVQGTDIAFWGTEADIQSHLADIEQSNRRILEQAGSFLSPQQAEVLSTVLSNGINARLSFSEAYIRRR